MPIRIHGREEFFKVFPLDPLKASPLFQYIGLHERNFIFSFKR
jgi:hypothetical protein